ncbi:MAG: class I SAM-dependent methyltransferase [Thermoanaerobaculia bacterium]
MNYVTRSAMADDQYAKFDYGRLINWDDRLKREWPFFEETLGSGPSKRILDLGSGTGEHARFLATHGFDVTGVEMSGAMLEKSRATPAPNVRFIEGDMRALPDLVDQGYGGALCVGNVLPHLTADEDLQRLAAGLRRVLKRGAPFVLQILNYDRIEIKKERSLPISFLPDPDDPRATIVFLRTMELLENGRAIFMPSTLRQRPDREPPLELLASRRVEIRTWRHGEIERAFREAGFEAFSAFGSYAKLPFDPAESRDLIFVAR